MRVSSFSPLLEGAGEAFYKNCQLFGIFSPRLYLEATVEVHAPKLWMVDGFDGIGIVGSDATAQQKARVALIGREHAPVEFLSRTTMLRRFGVENIAVARAFVFFRQVEIRRFSN